MKIIHGYKTRLRLNNTQRTLFQRYADVSRFVYNWGVAQRIVAYQETGHSPRFYEQNRYFNALKDREYPWARLVAATVCECALKQVDDAFTRFYRSLKEKKSTGFPRFKKKHLTPPRFRVRGAIWITPTRIRLPRLGWIRLSEHNYLPTTPTACPMCVALSYRAGEWYASLTREEDVSDPLPTEGPPLGVDIGIHHLAVCSNGAVFDNPRALEQVDRKLRRLQRELSRRQRGSTRWTKTRQMLAREFLHAENIRRHAQHQVSHYVTAKTKPCTVVIEDLNVAGMLQNRHLSRSVGDVGLGTLLRQIEYKAQWNGIEVVHADRWFASSQRCSNCGENVPKTLAVRVHTCPHCGLNLDRDLNAACNLALFATTVKHTGVARGVTAQ